MPFLDIHIKKIVEIRWLKKTWTTLSEAHVTVEDHEYWNRAAPQWKSGDQRRETIYHCQNVSAFWELFCIGRLKGTRSFPN